MYFRIDSPTKRIKHVSTVPFNTTPAADEMDVETDDLQPPADVWGRRDWRQCYIPASSAEVDPGIAFPAPDVILKANCKDVVDNTLSLVDKAIALTLLDLVNDLRVSNVPAKTVITPAAFRTLVKAKIDSL